MKNKEEGFFRMLFGLNKPKTTNKEDEKRDNEIQMQLDESTKRINNMALKYSIEKFEVAQKSPKIKKSRVTKGETKTKEKIKETSMELDKDKGQGNEMEI